MEEERGEGPTRVEALVLWDVDETLVDASGVSRTMYEMAFEQVVGRPLGQIAPMAGRTEHAILTETLALNGASLATFDVFWEALAAAAHALEDRLHESGRALPGAYQAIRALRRDGVVQSVATGNIAPIAALKLQAFDLADGLDLDVGGYGADDGVRAEIVRQARARTAAKYRVELAPDRVVVIGDTPFDVEAAHAAGAQAVGVATGRFTLADLTAAGADALFPDLTTPAALATTIVDQLLS